MAFPTGSPAPGPMPAHFLKSPPGHLVKQAPRSPGEASPPVTWWSTLIRMKTWSVTDPNGFTHTTTRACTHAIVRRDAGAEYFFVEWAAGLEQAETESRVNAAARTYNVIMRVEPVT